MTPLAIMVILVAGYVTGGIAALWALRDMARIPSNIWYWSGVWWSGRQRALLIGWLLGGYPAIFVALSWWRSPERQEMRDECAHRREVGTLGRHDRHRGAVVRIGRR